MEFVDVGKLFEGVSEDSAARFAMVDGVKISLETLALFVETETGSETAGFSRTRELVLNGNICAMIDGAIGKFLQNRNGGGPTDCK